ncbi:calmodulin-like protein 3, partial [Silene latifolia]|uniref:calmodulin-like protein 3 n=1 Tax=Silene latifolia TaxID=37657 RepID=UPI003D786583
FISSIPTPTLPKYTSHIPTSLLTVTISTPPPKPPSHTIDMADVRRVFDMFDQNGDGRITMGELNTSLHNMGIFIPNDDLAQMINQIDINGDGCVDDHEFESLYKLIMEREGDDGQDDEDDIKEAFNIFDKNGDGFISVEELRFVLESLGLNQGRSLEDCKLMIMKVDVDGDGRVNFKEFKKMMKEGGLASFN